MTHSVTVVQVPQRVVVAHESNRITTIATPEHAVVRVTAPRVAVVRTVEKVVVRGTGAQGPPGAGFTYYFHTQSTPAATWVIDHNIGHPVHVTLFVPNGTISFADVTENTVNQASITFSTPTTGSAYLS